MQEAMIQAIECDISQLKREIRELTRDMNSSRNGVSKIVLRKAIFEREIRLSELEKSITKQEEQMV